MGGGGCQGQSRYPRRHYFCVLTRCKRLGRAIEGLGGEKLPVVLLVVGATGPIERHPRHGMMRLEVPPIECTHESAIEDDWGYKEGQKGRQLSDRWDTTEQSMSRDSLKVYQGHSESQDAPTLYAISITT